MNLDNEMRLVRKLRGPELGLGFRLGLSGGSLSRALPPVTPSGTFRVGTDTGGGTLGGVLIGAKVKCNIPGITVDNSDISGTTRPYSGTPTGSAGPNLIAFYQSLPSGIYGYSAATVLPHLTPFSGVAAVKGFWSADLGVTESGGLVSAWLDQVAGISCAQATDAKKPLLSATSFAGVAGLTGDGIQTVLDYAGSLTFPSGTNTRDIYVLCSQDDPASSNVSRQVMAYGPSGGTAVNNTTALGRLVSSAVNRFRAIFGTGSAVSGVTDTQRDLTGYHFIHGSVDFSTQVSEDVDFYSTITATVSTNTATPNRFRAFSDLLDTPGSFWKGQIRAIILCIGTSGAENTAIANWRIDNMCAFLPTTPQGYARNAPVVSTNAAYATRTHNLVPSIAITPKVSALDRIWAIWYSAQGLTTADNPERAGNYCPLAYSDDDGATWTEACYILPFDVSKERVFDPQLYTLPDGRLLVLVSACASTADASANWDGVGGSWGMIVSTPSETPSYGPFTWLWDGVPGHPQLFGTEVRMMMDYWSHVVTGGIKPHFTKRQGKHLVRLIHNEAVPRVEYLSTIPTGAPNTFDESNVVRQPNGSNFCIWRASTGPYFSTQVDDFAAWSTPALYTQFPLYTNSTRHSMTRAPTGELVFVFNNSAARANMSIAIMSLAGVWSSIYTFDTRSNISYPVVDFKGDTAYITYDFERGFLGAFAKDIVLQKIPLASVRAGAGTKTTTTIAS